MNCPVCGHDDSRVLSTGEGLRRRECLHCKHRWTTVEVIKGTFTKAMRALKAVQQLASELE